MGYARVLALLWMALPLTAAPAPVRVWQGTLTLPTTLEGPPDSNPPFDVFATAKFNYPYTLRENLTDERKEIAWRAVYLENEYLKCSVLPDIGGHLYTCIDKLSGQPMFYANPSIKKAQIGYRGAWAAFGIEFNFPVSHNWVSMSPVPWAMAQNPDGSASILVGNIDRPYGMQWTVELTLRPGSTLLEQRVTLYNRSDVRHRFYWWNNAGVRVWDDSRICYPMRWTASHGFTEVDTWPVDSSGIDMSVVRNQMKGPVSRFVHGSREPFMGVYHPHTDTGVAHYADYGDLPGKKIWSWGVDADGLDWRRALSDDNSAYVEVQAGPMRNQETYAFLEPRQTLRFTEFWMPVRAIGGIARANLAGVLNLRREGGKLIAGFNANAAIGGGKVRILDGMRALYQTTADLGPGRVWSHELAAPAGRLTFELSDSGGRLLMRQTEGEYDWSPEADIRVGPQERSASAEAGSNSDPLETGTDQELNGNLLLAYDTYARALERSPEHQLSPELSPELSQQRLRVAAGRLAVALLRYQDGVRWLVPAQAAATYDPEIAYYLGLAYEALGQARTARTQFETARRMPGFRAAGSLRLAEMCSREGDYPKAIDYLRDGLRSAPEDQRAMEELTAVERAAVERAASSTSRGRPVDAAGLRLSLLAPDQLGSDPERVLVAAAAYMRLGLWREAVSLLARDYPEVAAERREPGLPLPQNHPVVAYYRAYCRQKLGESPAAEYAAASKLATAYVFPSGAQTLAVLEAAVAAQPGDATAHYLLGNLRLTSGLVDDAIAEWNTARRAKPGIPVLDASLGRTLLRLKHDPEAALDAFRAGLGPDPKNNELYTGIAASAAILGRPAEERVTALERYPDPARMPASLVYELALSYAETARFDKAGALFENRFFPREEGGTNVRQVWIRVRALEAHSNAERSQCSEALNIVDHLGDAVPRLAFTRDGLTEFIAAPLNQFTLGSVESRCGRSAAASQRLEALTSRSDPSRSDPARSDPATVLFAYQLARNLAGFRPADWSGRLESAASRAESAAAGSSWNAAVYGLLQLALGHAERAAGNWKSALLMPDRNLAHHLSRVALHAALAATR